MTHEEELMNRTSLRIEPTHAINLWNEFYDEVRHKNRFFPHSDFVERYIYPLASEKYRSTIHQEATPLYRARLISPEDYRHMKFDEQIHGFDRDYSGAPPAEYSVSGRANPAGVSYLYLASSPETACSEVCPFPTQLISVAEFKLKRDISVVNLHRFDLCEDDEVKRSGLYVAMQSIMWSFMVPCNQKTDTEYAPSQYVAAYLESQGIDGVQYASSHNPAKDSFNLVLFDPTLGQCCSDRGIVYRCLGETKYYQNMTAGLSDEEKVKKSKRQFPTLADRDIDEIRDRMRRQIGIDQTQ